MARREEVVIVVGASADRVEAAVRLFPEATVVSTPSLSAAIRWLEEAAHVAAAHSPTLHLDGLEIDVEDHQVTRGGVPLDLSEQEVRMLGCLASNPGRARGFEELFVHGWGKRYLQDRGAVQAAVKRLRAKLSDAEADVVIEAVRGVGFRLRARDAAVSAAPAP